MSEGGDGGGLWGPKDGPIIVYYTTLHYTILYYTINCITIYYDSISHAIRHNILFILILILILILMLMLVLILMLILILVLLPVTKCFASRAGTPTVLCVS